jgi:hypothetical protein
MTMARGMIAIIDVMNPRVSFLMTVAKIMLIGMNMKSQPNFFSRLSLSFNISEW